MALTESVWTCFVDGLPPSAQATPALRDALETALHTATREVPELGLEPDAFARYVAERLDEQQPRLDDIRIAELYIAHGCVIGNPRALALLETRYFGELDRALARMNLGGAHVDDVKQTLRQQMLVATEDAAPRIAQYAGRGALAGWLRVSAVRSALKLLRPAQREVSSDERLFELPSAESAPELAQLKRDYQADFRAAFVTALESLSDRDKNLVRQHHIDDLSIDELAVLYKVHRATVARWVAQARQDLLSRTRTALIARVEIEEGECDSIMRLVHSQLDLTLRRLLA